MSGLSTSPDWFKAGVQAGQRFGYSVSTAGDVDGDGFSDVVVGAPNSSGQGSAYVFNGSASGISATAGWTGTGEAGARYGFTTATAGDFNGDGYADLIVGAHYNSNGKAFVYEGSATGLTAGHVWTTSGDGSVTAYGFCVSTAGDINGDGYSDALIGAYEPKAFVYHGSPAGFPASGSWSVSGTTGSLGKTVASASDVNGDGYSDVVIGDPEYFVNSHIAGKFSVYYGSSAGLASTPSFEKTGSLNGNAEYSVAQCGAPAGDVNGDG